MANFEFVAVSAVVAGAFFTFADAGIAFGAKAATFFGGGGDALTG